MPGLGHNAYLAVAKESTWGTKVVAGMDFLEFMSESIQTTFSEKIVQGINNSRVRTKRMQGAKTVAGDIAWEVNPEDVIGDILKAVLPTEALIDDGVGNGGQHSFTEGNALPAGLTVQIGRSSQSDGSWIAGNVRDYFGGRATSLTLESALDEFLKATASLTFQNEEAGTNQAPTYDTQNPLIYHTGSITIDGTPVLVSAFSLVIATGMKTDRKKLASNLIQQQQPGMYDVSGSITAYFDDMVLVNKFLNNTAGAIILDLTGPLVGTTTRRLKIEVPVAYFNGETPKITGADTEAMLTIPFRAIKTGAGSPNSLLKVTLANSKRTAY